MAFIKEDGFTIFKNGEWGDFLVIETERLQECIAYLKKRRMKNVHVNRYYGYKARDLAFLSDIDFIEGFTTTERIDFTILNSLRNLKTLGVPDNGKDIINLVNFPKLEKCAVTFSKRLQGLEACKLLQNLTLTGYQSETKDLTSFPQLPAIRSLLLIKPAITSLSGIGKLSTLRSFECSLMKGLTSVSDLKEISDSLESLILQDCRKIRDHEEIGCLKKLKKLILGNCGEMKSINFIRKLPGLIFFSFVNTNVVDGDLTPCIEHLNLQYVGFMDKRHYSHRFDEIKLLLESRAKKPKKN